MFRIQFGSMFKSEYQELSLCIHDYDMHGPFARPYKAEKDHHAHMPD